MFQLEIFSQQGYSGKKKKQSVRIYPGKQYSVSTDMPVRNIQSVRIFRQEKISQHGYSSTKNSVSKDIPARYFSPQEYSSKKYSVGKDVQARNIQPVRMSQQEIFSR
jgi:hypothetical protein